jgi:hypothetical protein
VIARREIRRAVPPEGGGRLATAAIALGLVQVAGFVVLLGVFAALRVSPGSAFPIARGPAAAPPPPAAPAAPSSRALPGTARGTLDPRQRETAIGAITVVDLGADSGALSQIFQSQYEKAEASGGRVLAFVVGPDCSPCNGVSLALTDSRIQRALGGWRIVRVDVRERADELTLLGIPVETIPGLALLAPGARTADYLHGGEWDADIPDNIAPVLTDFVTQGHRPRRYPWRGVRRPDETAL